MPFKLEPLIIKEISFVDKGASGDDDHRPSVVFWKSATNKGSDMPDASKVESILAAMSEEDRNVMVEALAASKQEPEPPKEPEKQEPKNQEPPPEKEKPEEEMAKGQIEMQKQLDDAKATIRKLESEKLLDSFVKVAETEMGHIPGMDHADLGAVLKACSEHLPKETFGKLKTTLTACSRVIEKGDLFVEIGSAGDRVNSHEKLETLAKQYQEQNKGVSFYQAYAKVARDNPQLLREDQ